MTAQRPKSIFACIDGSTLSSAVVDYATWLAQSAEKPLHLLHRIEHNNIPAPVDLTGAIGLGASEELLTELTVAESYRSKLLLKKGTLVLNAAKEKALQKGVSVEVDQQHGHLIESLIDLESQIHALVVGIRGEAHEDAPQSVGAQLETMIRSLHQPILVVNGEFKIPKKIMLAYDGSESCEKAVAALVEGELLNFMGQAGVTCHLVHCSAQTPDVRLFTRAEHQLSQQGFAVKTKVLSGKKESVLAAYQIEHEIDLMIMGAFSHHPIRDFLLGSFTAKMLHQTNRPLLLLR